MKGGIKDKAKINVITLVLVPKSSTLKPVLNFPKTAQLGFFVDA